MGLLEQGPRRLSRHFLEGCLTDDKQFDAKFVFQIVSFPGSIRIRF